MLTEARNICKVSKYDEFTKDFNDLKKKLADLKIEAEETLQTEKKAADQKIKDQLEKQELIIKQDLDRANEIMAEREKAQLALNSAKL